MKKWKTRIKAIWYILTKKYNHFVIINVDDESLKNQLSDQDYDVDILYCGLQPYNYYKMVIGLSKTKDDIDMVLMKAKFEADAFEKYNPEQ